MITALGLSALLTIVALGDSITAAPRPASPGAAAATARGARARKKAAAKRKQIPPGRPYPAYVELVGRALGTGEKTVNAGVGGDTSTKMLARFDKDVAAHGPRIVLIMAGMNDAAYVDPGPAARTEPRIPLTEFTSNLKALVERVRQAGGQAILLTSSPMTRAYIYQTMPFYQENDMNDGLTPYVDATRRVAREAKACLADVFGEWTPLREHRAWIPDGIHPNAEGHRRIAAKVMEACSTVLRGQ